MGKSKNKKAPAPTPAASSSTENKSPPETKPVVVDQSTSADKKISPEQKSPEVKPSVEKSPVIEQKSPDAKPTVDTTSSTDKKSSPVKNSTVHSAYTEKKSPPETKPVVDKPLKTEQKSPDKKPSPVQNPPANSSSTEKESSPEVKSVNQPTSEKKISPEKQPPVTKSVPDKSSPEKKVSPQEKASPEKSPVIDKSSSTEKKSPPETKPIVDKSPTSEQKSPDKKSSPVKDPAVNSSSTEKKSLEAKSSTEKKSSPEVKSVNQPTSEKKISPEKQPPATKSVPDKSFPEKKVSPQEKASPEKSPVIDKSSSTEKKSPPETKPIVDKPPTTDKKSPPEAKSSTEKKSPPDTKPVVDKPPTTEQKSPDKKSSPVKNPAANSSSNEKKSPPEVKSVNQPTSDKKSLEKQPPAKKSVPDKPSPEKKVSPQEKAAPEKEPAVEKSSSNEKTPCPEKKAPVPVPENPPPKVSTPVELKCPICQKISISRCGGCSKIAYCSREHQKLHWKIHKGDCGLYKVSESPELGRYLTAVREIKAGKIIIQENPLILTPPRITSPVCLGCYHEFPAPDENDEQNPPSEDDIKPTPCGNNCGWPMCNSITCKENRRQHEAECKISLARGGLLVKHFGQDHPMYQSVGILRALSLRETCPEAFKQFLSLQSNDKLQAEAMKSVVPQETGESSNEESILPQPDMTMTVALLQNFFKQQDDEELLRRISGIIETNGHEIPIPGDYGQITRRLIGVYYVSSFLEHHCRPNCVKSWDSKTKSIIIRSSVTINKGDHLSISYVDPLWGTNDRQHFLQMTKFFTCKCERCTDPTELGCHISSIRCQQAQCTLKLEAQKKGGVTGSSNVGMIVPMDPLNAESDWKCHTCGEEYPCHYAGSIVEKIGREIEEFQKNRGDIEAEEEFIRKYSRVLAPNHFYLLEMKVELGQVYGRTAAEPLPMLPPPKLLRKKTLCEELLHVFNVIVPGYNRLRNLILYELQAVTGVLSKLKHSVGDISTKTHIEELLHCRVMLLEVIKVLSWEPELSVEYRRCEGAKQELIELDSLIETMHELQTNLAMFSTSKNNSFQATSSTPTSTNDNIPTENNNVMITSAEDDELELF